MQGIRTLREAPFDKTAGVICSPDKSILDNSEEARLAVWQAGLYQPLQPFFKTFPARARLMAIDSTEFRVSRTGGRIQISPNQAQFDFSTLPERVKQIESFGDIFDNTSNAEAAVEVMETLGNDAVRHFGDEQLYVLTRSLTATTFDTHIDFTPNMAAILAEHAMYVVHPNGVTPKPYDKHSLNPRFLVHTDDSQLRLLEPGDVCMIGEIGHGTYVTPVEPAYRNGVWLGFYSKNLRNPSFEKATNG